MNDSHEKKQVLKRRSFLKICGIALGGAMFGPPVKAMNQAKTPAPLSKQVKPNIVFIFSDDHSTQTIGAYGSKINQTPNIDRIANEGAVFTNSFCTNSICQPSRAAVLTGKHSHLNGVTGNGSRWNGRQTVFPRLLQAAGYQTSLIGKWHMKPEPTDEFEYWKVLCGSGGQGDYYNPSFSSAKGQETITGYSTDIITDMVIDWMTAKRDTAKPFLLMVQYKSPHVPRLPAVRHLNLFKDAEIPEPSTLYDDYSTRQPYASQAWMQVSGLNEEILHIFPPKNSDIKPDKTQKEWLSRLSEEDREKFHQAYDEENAKYYGMKKSGAFNDEKTRTKYFYQRFIKDYLRCVTSVDENVGRILDCLDKNKLADNTIVVYSSDQSYFVGEHGWAEKRWMYEESLRMPMIIRWPQKIQPGQKIHKLILNMDYAPTFLETAGLPVPQEMQGESLLPLLTGNSENIEWRKSIYYHYYDHGGHNVPRHDGIRTYRFKLIHFYTDDVYEMYDLKKDPYELKNVYEASEYQKIRQKLLAELTRLRKEFDVPAGVFEPPYRIPEQTA